MSDYYWLREAQLERIEPFFPRSHGRPGVDDRRVISGIIHVIRNGLRMSDFTGAKLHYPHLAAAETLFADKGYNSGEFRDALSAKGSQP